MGYRPGFDVELLDTNVTLMPLNSSSIVANGIALRNWSTADHLTSLIPPEVALLPLNMKVDFGMPFELTAPFQVSGSQSGGCDPHIRPDPSSPAPYVIGSKPMYADISFWCKLNTGTDYASFNATFKDEDEYYTTKFGFRKVSAHYDFLLAYCLGV